MPISFEDAKKQVSPSLDDTDSSKDQNGLTEADRSALALVAGSAANEAYWNSRSRIEQLEAAAAGHGVIVRADDEESPTGLGTGTDKEPVIDSTATEEPATVPAGEPAASEPKPTPDNSTEAVATLRAQLRDAGINPEA